jgi:hypothetical protein
MLKRYGAPVRMEITTLTTCLACGRVVPVSPVKVGTEVKNLCAECAKTWQTDSDATAKPR